MTRWAKLLNRILRGTSDANIVFDELRGLLCHLGFEERIRGDHHIFTQEDIEEILNLQPRGSKAKSYQVKQVRNVILKYKLGGEDDSL
ncbi:MAG: type II toxin-antitoxin system HicA family toxin [Anaerolineae bacterium]|nr:type II toxin-antitoxin system HicA family toxin [Anaerolineae bacterium]